MTYAEFESGFASATRAACGARPPRVEELQEPPKVGERYRVPCVEAGGLYLPTLGPWHIDEVLAPEIGVHVHYDPRFFDLEWLLDRLRPDDLPPEQVLMVVAHVPRSGITSDLGRAEQLWEAELPCLREMPAFPRGHAAAPWLATAEAAYAGRPADRLPDGCAACPHRATRLGSLPWREGTPGTPRHRECIHGLRISDRGVVLG